MLQEKAISNFFHGKSATALVMVVAVLCCLLAWQRGAVAHISGNLGLGLPAPNGWLPFTPLSALVNMGLSLLMALLFIYINRRFNILRSLTALPGTMFLAMLTALPTVTGQFYGGSLLLLIGLWCLSLLYSVYAEPRGQRQVFLIFFLLSAASFTQAAFVFYMPVFLIGCIQMRILNLRTVIAALLGIITPPWILFGFGIVDPRHMEWPQLVVAWSAFDKAEIAHAMAVTVVTVSAGVVFTVANILKILSYNSRVRAYNGFLTLLEIFTAIFILLNFNNFTFYIPLLDCLVAYQIGHFFTYRRSKRSYIPILLLMLLYFGLYVWGILS